MRQGDALGRLLLVLLVGRRLAKCLRGRGVYLLFCFNVLMDRLFHCDFKIRMATAKGSGKDGRTLKLMRDKGE